MPCSRQVFETLHRPSRGRSRQATATFVAINQLIFTLSKLAIHSDQQRRIQCDRIQAGDDRLGDMFGCDDTAAAQQGEFIPPVGLNQGVVGCPDQVKDERALRAAPVIIGGEMKNTDTFISIAQ